MFGRVRASPTSLDCLERSNSKILKDDSLSIYEATLLKLKLGAKREFTHPSNYVGEMVIDSDVGVGCLDGTDVMATSETISRSQDIDRSTKEEMMTDTDLSVLTTVSSTSDCDSFCSSRRQRPKNVSVLDLFHKYESTKCVVKSSEESGAVECGSPSITTSLADFAQTMDSSTSMSVCD